MFTITLPDGSQRQLNQPITVLEFATSISAGLAKAAIAGRIGDQWVDTSYLISKDAHLTIITDRDEAALDIIRHSTAHLLAQAVKQLFPSAQVTIGPVIEDGFYYDFSFERAFTPDDLEKIEARMHEIAKKELVVSREIMTRDEAIHLFQSMNEFYKVKIIQDIPATETLTLYRQGEFIDLCRGPHVPNTGKLKIFKLMKLAGAYWRGDSNNEMLQRIYGTAWADKKSLDTYLYRLEEAEKRDHRKLAKRLHLFHIQEEAPGMIFWHPNGWIIYREIENYIREKIKSKNYFEIRTPQLVDRSLWEASGHWANFSKEMFISESENRDYAIKPMNCPCHVQVFKQGLRSYKELPLRFAEFGCCHRNEPSGSMHGLMRVRQMTQDDGHIFCMENQIQSETEQFIQLLLEVYRDFGFDEVFVKLATRPDKRIGEDAVWDYAEKALSDALNNSGLAWKMNPGEGAFYGPKVEFHLKDCLGRLWQCGTLQLDYSMPERLGAQYVAEDSTKRTPVMLHRAIIGTLERFIGILIEHTAGKLPAWLAPVQVAVLSITGEQAEYVLEITEHLQRQGLRVRSDLRNEKMGFKIREHTLQYTPYLLVIGEREREAKVVRARTLDGADLGEMSLDAFVEQVQVAVSRRCRR